MLKIIQAIRKALIVLFLLLGMVTVVTGIYCYRYQDQITQKLLDATSKRLGYQVQVRAAQLNVFKYFPNIALTCHGVTIKDRLDDEEALVALRKLHGVFDIWKFMRGQYVLAYLYLEQGSLHIKKDLKWPLDREAGVKKEAQPGISLAVKVQKISLKDVEIAYGSQSPHCKIGVKQMQASLKWECAKLEADLQGKAIVRRIQIQDVAYASNLPISLKAVLSYDQQKRSWALRATQLGHGSALLDVQGNGGLAAAAPIVLSIQGKEIRPQCLLRCLPQQYYQKSKPYDLRGGLDFSLNVRRQLGKPLSLQGNFLLRHGAIKISQSLAPVALSRLSGHLNIPDIQRLETATLSVNRLNGNLARSQLTGSFTLRNFIDLQLQCNADTLIDLSSLGTSPAHASIKEASGQLRFHGALKANLQPLMRGVYTKDNLLLSGELQAQAVQFKLVPSQCLCKNIIGKLVFKDNDLAMQDVSGMIGSGSFALSGTIQNLLPYLFYDNQKLFADAQFYTDYLDLDALHYGKQLFTSVTGSDTFKLAIAPHWVLNLHGDIQQLHFRRFRGKNVRGKLVIKDQKLIAEKLQLGVAGGKVLLDSTVNTGGDDLDIRTIAQLQGVRISDLFYTFENFHQRFLVDTHLNGKVFSDIDLTMRADKQGNVRWDTLHAAIDLRIIDGALHDFEPLQKLARYADKEHLANLRFSELKNHILIKDTTIHIPLMEVYADPTRIRLSGTHTFDGKINYRFLVPFLLFQQQQGDIALDEAAKAAGLHLSFNLKGDINDYKISHDAEAFRKSLTQAIKVQRKDVLKALVQGASQKNKQLQELALEDYFEFDE
ncbi:MAG: AsmA family protein [Bacteroidota bacterium]